MQRLVPALALAVWFAPVGSALAADGILEINQTCALSIAGCFPGDSGGFPVTISQPGSYRLTSDLAVPDGNTTGISISASSVTVDLGGFTLSGPNLVNDTPSCSAGSTVPGGDAGTGIHSTNDLTIVRNGRVRGMGSNGVTLLANSRIEGVIADNNCGVGLRIGEGGVIADSQARRSRLAGIHLSTSEAGSLVESSVAFDNMSYGFHIGRGSLALGCVAGKNRNHGFFGSATEVGVANSVFFNNVNGVVGGRSVGCNMFDGTVVCAPPTP